MLEASELIELKQKDHFRFESDFEGSRGFEENFNSSSVGNTRFASFYRWSDPSQGPNHRCHDVEIQPNDEDEAVKQTIDRLEKYAEDIKDRAESHQENTVYITLVPIFAFVY